MIAAGDDRIVSRDADGCYRFHADFRNVGDLDARLDALSDSTATTSKRRASRCAPFMKGFQAPRVHRSVRQHVRLRGPRLHLLAHGVEAAARDAGEFLRGARWQCGAEVCQRLGGLYYRVREGIGFNKTPAEYGAFPTDPYSHTPGHGGAQQPGMTGQVKEEVLSRFGELGLRVAGGAVHFDPRLLRACEFSSCGAPVPLPRRPRPVAGVDGSGVGAGLHLVPGSDRLSSAQRRSVQR